MTTGTDTRMGDDVTMADGIEIRPLGIADANAYRALWCAAIVDSPQYFRTSFADAGIHDLPPDDGHDQFTLGALSGGRLVGIVSLRRDAQEKLRHKALVYRMYVDPAHAGSGVGRALLRRLIDRVERHTDILRLHLTVLANNVRAVRLYASLGFVEYAREPEAVRIGETFVDELQMSRRMR